MSSTYKIKQRLYLIISAALIVITNIFLNAQYVLHMQIVDDLAYWELYSQMSPIEFICNTYADKFRPVYNLFIWVVYTMVGTHYDYIYIANIIVNIGIAVVIFIICRCISHRQLLSLCSALAYSCSVLAYYQITQVFGLMESLGLLLSILFVYSLYAFMEKKQFKHFGHALIIYFVISFIHERYITYIFALLVVLCIADWKEGRKTGILGTSGAFVSIFALRFLALHSIGLTGTGGTNITDTLSIPTIFKFVCYSIGYMFGINYGHPSMSLFSFSGGWNDYGAVDWILVFIPVLCVVILFVLFLLSQKGSKIRTNNNLKIMLLFLVCIGIGLGAASVTVRVELRWIYTPFSIMLMALAFLATHTRFRQGVYIGIAMLFCTIIFHTGHRQYFNRLYYWPTLCFGEELYEKTVGNYGSDIKDMNIVLIMDTDELAFINDEYLLTYFSQFFEVRQKIMRISDIAALTEPVSSDAEVLLLHYEDMALKEVRLNENNQ